MSARVVLCGILVILIHVIPVFPASGQAKQNACTWTPLINVSESPDLDSRQPVATGDVNGRVHAFWVEAPMESPGLTGRQFVAYRYLDSTKWSPVADVLLAPENGWASVGEAVADPDGRFLYLAWVDNLGVNVSAAETAHASDARAWNTTRLATGGNMGSPALTIDSEGRLHALYTRDFRTLVYVTSNDHGVSWAEIGITSEVSAQDQVIWHPNLLVDRQGGLHATWAINEQQLDWTPSGIRYAHSFDGGLSWSAPVEFAEVPGGDPTLAEDSIGKIHLLWNGRVGTGGRYHTWTSDRGTTWAPMKKLDGYVGGLSGRPQIVADSSGTLHVLQGSMLKDGGGVNSAVLIGDDWSYPISIPNAPGSDYPALAINNGNWLHAFVWTQDEPAEILYASCQTGTPELTPVPTSEVLSSTAVLTPEVKPEISIPTATPVEDQLTETTSLPEKQSRVPDSSASHALSPILVGAVSALMLILVTVIVYRKRGP